MYLIIILVLILYFYYSKRRGNRYYELIKKFPAVGIEFPVIGSAWKFRDDSEALMKAIADVFTKSVELGGAARIYLFTVYYIVLSDARDTAYVLKTCLEKDYIYKFLRTFSGNGSAFSSGPQAKERRGVLVPSFHPRLLYSYVDIFWEESVKLADTLATHVGNGPFSVKEHLHKYNFGTVLRSGISISDVNEYADLYDVMNKWEMMVKERIIRIWQHPDCVYRLCPEYAEGVKVVKIGHHYAQKILNHRVKDIYDIAEANSDTNKILKEGIFDAIMKSDLTEEEKREEVLVIVIGTDLVAFGIGFTLMLLGMYPEVQDRIYKEIQDVLDTDRPIAKDDLSKLNYLEMVIKESMRLYPPVPLIARQVQKDITLPSGKGIPAGTGVFAAILGIHKNPMYWGPDADRFDPDRFSPERIPTVPSEAYIPFSFGPRNCIGYKFGQISMKVAISTILRKFKIVGKPADGPVPNIRTKFGIYMRSNNDFEIELEHRD